MTVNHKGIVNVEAPKKVSAANLLDTLQPTQPLVTTRVIDQGATSEKHQLATKPPSNRYRSCPSSTSTG